ncbi:MAG: dioxygenase [Sphingomonadales bacterium]|nr:dioxygenase [Sphingomonadales bacterium]
MTQRLPALFLGHGSPMTIITDNPELRAMKALGAALGQRLPRPRAILCISAHYESMGRTHLTTGAHPKTIHDFRGFPDELYRITYPAPGDDGLVDRIAALLGEDRIRRDDQWGFDHGVYGVLLPLLGHAEIPTVAMSLDRSLSPEQHLATARALAPLRDEGVLIVASGNVIHNLALWRQSQGTRPDWALDFRARTNAALLAGNDAALTRFPTGDHAAMNAVNSGEHYLPLLYAVGARLPGDEVAIFNDTLDGALSMTSVLYGDAGLLN